MSISKIIGYIRGSVTIRAEGMFLERFLNICMHRNILLRDVKRRGENAIDARISIRGFREIRPIARKTRTRVRLCRRYGLPFFLHRFHKRRFALSGVFLFIAVLWYLSSHIMGIDIIGCERLSAAEIEQGLKNAGVYRGAAVRRIEPKSVQNKMMTAFDDIAWIGVNIKGSKAYIEVRERLDTKRVENADVPCNLIACRDGIIRLLEVKAGQTTVKVNDMVEKGDLLVSGVIDSTKEGIRYAHSFGEVYADTEYQKSGTYPLEYVEKIYTGEAKSKFTVSAFGKALPLYFKSGSPFEYSDKTETRTEYSLFGNKLPPFAIGKVNYREYTPEKRKRTAEQTVNLAKKELEKELKSEISPSAEIKDIEMSFVEEKNSVTVTVKILCYEDIAEQSAIDKIENLNYNEDSENT